MTTPIKLYRYDLPNVDGEGWAIIVLGSDGFFSAVSDYGNYGHYWSAHGTDDFRQFVLRRCTEVGWESNAAKLGHGTEYDGAATCAAIETEIRRRREAGELSDCEALNELELLEDHDDVSSSQDLALWLNATELEQIFETGLVVYSHPSDVRAFCQKTLPRLAEVLCAELAAERSAA